MKYQYIWALYWTVQTLSTVGYGDVGVGNDSELVFTIAWMFFGVAFYSFAIGNLQNIVAQQSKKAEGLEQKLSTFGKMTNLDLRLYQ